MPANISDIIDNVKRVYMTDSALETLMDYERVLDDLDLYTFANWKRGELVEGPIYEKYFVTCKWMYDFRSMPDPRGGERLLGYGCEVDYTKTMLSEPKEIVTQDDQMPGTKFAKHVERPVWIVSVTIPKKLMSDIHQGSIEIENDTLDAEELDDAYENGADKMEKQNQGAGMDVMGGAPLGGAPAPVAPGGSPLGGGGLGL